MCRKTLAKRLQAKYVAAKENIVDHLLKLNHVCTTADLWTAHGKSYLGMTCHWLHPTSYERNSICLAIRRVTGRHTYNVIASSLDSINLEFGVENKTAITITDSGSNMFLGLGHADHRNIRRMANLKLVERINLETDHSLSASVTTVQKERCTNPHLNCPHHQELIR